MGHTICDVRKKELGKTTKTHTHTHTQKRKRANDTQPVRTFLRRCLATCHVWRVFPFSRDLHPFFRFFFVILHSIYHCDMFAGLCYCLLYLLLSDASRGGAPNCECTTNVRATQRTRLEGTSARQAPLVLSSDAMALHSGVLTPPHIYVYIYISRPHERESGNEDPPYSYTIYIYTPPSLSSFRFL